MSVDVDALALRLTKQFFQRMQVVPGDDDRLAFDLVLRDAHRFRHAEMRGVGMVKPFHDADLPIGRLPSPCRDALAG